MFSSSIIISDIKSLYTQIFVEELSAYKYYMMINIFQLQKTSENIIKITASSGVAAAWGFHYYLKHFCKAHISWEATQLNMPDVLPMVHLKIVSNDR